jgi:hypothetical protein
MLDNGVICPASIYPKLPQGTDKSEAIWVKLDDSDNMDMSKTTILKLNSNDTIDMVKTKICDQTGIPPHRQRFIVVDDDDLLKEIIGLHAC